MNFWPLWQVLGIYPIITQNGVPDFVPSVSWYEHEHDREWEQNTAYLCDWLEKAILDLECED